MNLTDLKQVLDERSAESAENAMHHVRLQGVRTKVVTRRRRRAAAWAACAMVALAGTAAAAVLPGLRTDVTPSPMDSPSPVRMVEGFPEFAQGSRVVAAASAELPQRRIELTFVPTTLDLVFFSRCAVPGGQVFLDGKLTINGHLLTSGSCGVSTRHEGFKGMGVTVGKPVTLVMTIIGAHQSDEVAGDREVAVPDAGTWGFAVGERMPFDRYPLPARPSGPLGRLDGALPAGCTEARCPGSVVIRSDPADPARPVRRTLTWKSIDSLDMVAQTPGLLHVRVNGVEITTGEWWDYERTGSGMYGDKDGEWKREFGLDLRTGDRVTIEMVPEYVTGDWQVVLYRSQFGAGG